MKIKQKLKLFIILGVEFIAIAVMLVLIFFAGKKVHTVTFDLDGGMLLGGDPVQKVTQGQSATPPSVTKEGCYFLKWSASYREITRDIVIKAIWEYETSYGIEYNMPENSNYCTISGCFPDLVGDLYIGAYHEDRKVLGIEPNAFANCEGITGIHLLDGILVIGENAFANCTNLQFIELPKTTYSIGENAFQNCVSLEEIVLPTDLKTLGRYAFNGCESLKSVTVFDGLTAIGEGAFAGCDALEELIIPSSVERIGVGAFDGQELLVYTYLKEEEKPDGWENGWLAGGAKVEWEYVDPLPEDEETDKKIGKK